LRRRPRPKLGCGAKERRIRRRKGKAGELCELPFVCEEDFLFLKSGRPI
jgi:hypothetical protein